MKIVDLIKEKTQRINLEGFTAEALELQVRELRTSLSERLALVRTSDIWSRLGPAPGQSNLLSGPRALVVAHPDLVPLDVSPAARAYHANLLKQLGFQVHEGDWFEITQEAIDTFASVTKDHQWIHLDSERARRESPFRSTVAQGFLIVAMIPALRAYEGLALQTDFPVRMVVNCGIDRVRFLYPVKPGSRIRARTILKKVELNRKYVEVTEEVNIEIEAGLKCACLADIVYRVYL